MTMASVLMKNTLVHDGYQFGGTGDWRLWVGKMPTSPDRAICIYDSGGLAPNPRYLLDYPSVQIKVRGGQSDYAVAGAKIAEVRDRLLGRTSYDAYNDSGVQIVVNPDRIVAINAIGDIAFMGWDDAARPEFVCNLTLIIEPSPATSPTNRDPL